MDENECNSNISFKQVIDLSDRTEDVKSNATFDTLMIGSEIIRNLTRYGFQRPSPVQAKAIPLGLLGMDMLVQAKTGTGKTLVFAILAADHLLANRERSPQVMIVSPTREIAMQSYETIRKICPSNTFAGLFVGGIDMSQDRTFLQRGCRVAVGTSGRLAHLIKCRFLNPTKISLFVLDEADKLMEDSFKSEINYLFSSLQPDSPQVCVFSATYPHGLDEVLCKYMKEPSLIRLDAEDSQLLGLMQYAVCEQKRKDVKVLLDLLDLVSFSQCLVFTNSQKKCSIICEHLLKKNHYAQAFSSIMTQEERFKVMKDFKNFRIRILVSTDVTARGIDVENVNMIVNIECPQSAELYLHRIGRAGRFGTRGASFTILSNPIEVHRFGLMAKMANLNVKMLDMRDGFPSDLVINSEYFLNVAKEFAKLSCFSELTTDVKSIVLLNHKLNRDRSSEVSGKTYSSAEVRSVRISRTKAEWLDYFVKNFSYLDSHSISIFTFDERLLSNGDGFLQKFYEDRNREKMERAQQLSIYEQEKKNKVNYVYACGAHIEVEEGVEPNLPSQDYERLCEKLKKEYDEYLKENFTPAKYGEPIIPIKRKCHDEYMSHMKHIIVMLEAENRLNITLSEINLALSEVGKEVSSKEINEVKQSDENVVINGSSTEPDNLVKNKISAYGDARTVDDALVNNSV